MYFFFGWWNKMQLNHKLYDKYISLLPVNIEQMTH